MLTLLGAEGSGSAIVEAAFELTGVPYRLELLDTYDLQSADRLRLEAINPLGQVPTLLLDDGSVVTESAAMVLMAADTENGGLLAPPPGDRLRAPFLRWLIFLVGAIYPTFTYGDYPARYVAGDAATALRDSTDAQRQAMWRQVEEAASAPWFLGERRSAIDLYIWAMVHWRPRRDWFRQEAPKLSTIADALDADPALAEIRRRNGWD